jgi:hypothetical protein
MHDPKTKPIIRIKQLELIRKEHMYDGRDEDGAVELRLSCPTG